MTATKARLPAAVMRAEEAMTAEQRRRATRAVASLSADAQECAMLLEMLGLDASEGRAQRQQ
ncbi:MULTISPECIES: hypothetical protein [Thermocrispum]|jgi:lysophospholipid acyltransferase (LPLAT)-like uncharacterized protein|uniref:Uncharacterized protein n=1 Tax=Thermocrispum agreste TaxID=37925 RepID=A0A2W4KNA3_9PSEU|nr:MULTISPECIES: hypothetical protein [Thermocrispum]PZM90039.1 MAG: hypothetical protein DIU77_18405 [Thermocrispum agreste]